MYSPTCLARLLRVTVAVTGIVLLTSCSETSPPAANLASQAGLQSLVQATEEVGTLRFDARISSSAWAFDWIASGEVDFDRGAVQVAYDRGDEQFVMLFRQDSVLTKGGDYAGLGDSTWVTLDVSRENGDWAEDRFWANPSAILRATSESATNVDFVGQAVVRGAMATHLSVKIDQAKWIERLASEGILDPVGNLPSENQLSLFIDGENRLTAVEVTTVAASGDSMFVVDYRFEFFGHGVESTIRLPRPREVVTQETAALLMQLFDSAGVHPFEGAECYDRRIFDCLQPNPQLDAIAVSPELCHGPARVCLVPAGAVRKDVVESIVEFHRDTAGIEILVLPGLRVTPLDVDTNTFQVPGRVLFDQAQRTYFPGDVHPSTYIVIAPFDLSSNGGGWYFGARFGWRLGGHQHGVFSYFRMANVAPYDGSKLDDALLMERVNKYTGRYTALLYLGHELQWDRDFLNYAEMYGFSDLDSMGAAWPTWEAPCRTNEPVICIVPDGIYESQAFESDLAVAVRRLNRDLPVHVHMRTDGGGYVPTWDPWSEEFAIDLHGSHRDFIFNPAITVIGVTDDAFRDVPSGDLHMEHYDPAGVGVVSAFGAGAAGSREHQERLYRLLLRAIAIQHFGVEVSADTSSLLWSGALSPSQLDRLDFELPFE